MLRVWVVAPLSATRRRLERAVVAPDVVIGSSAGESLSFLDLRPDVVLAEGSAEVQAPAEPPWVVLTDAPATAAAPVRALLPRDAEPAQIQAALQGVSQGLVCLHPVFTGTQPVVAGRPPAALTGREREVLVSLAAGLGNKEIAAQLGVSEHTVKFHLGSIFSKLDVATRTEAVTAGLRQGLVML